MVTQNIAKYVEKNNNISFFYAINIIKRWFILKRIIIEGNKPLSGKIKIGGAKNSVVALIPAAIMANGNVHISNVPNISDIDALIEILV